jgi:hypothetical protein
MNTNNTLINNNQKDLIQEELFTFINEIITGIELKIYNQLTEQNKLSQIQTSEIMFMGMNYLEVYLSVICKGLLEKTDPLICEKISTFSSAYSIEDKFMLNIITNTIMKAYPKFTRSKLCPDSKEIYLTSIQDILTTMSKYIRFIFNSDMDKLLKACNK